MSSESEYKFTAFISYRHVAPDRKWAMWLHSALETFRVPKQFVSSSNSFRLKRIFRDEEELPASANLSKEIDQALLQSRYLIVVCSPRTPESQWVNQEIIRFRELGRQDRILALLIEGEPKQALPRSLREVRPQTTESKKSTLESMPEIEPLAADVRLKVGVSV